MYLRLARSVNSKASRNPSTAPTTASKNGLLSSDRLPLPAIRKPQYPKAKVQGITRQLLMEPTSSVRKVPTIPSWRPMLRGGLWHGFLSTIAMILGHQDLTLGEGTTPATARTTALRGCWRNVAASPTIRPGLGGCEVKSRGGAPV